MRTTPQPPTPWIAQEAIDLQIPTKALLSDSLKTQRTTCRSSCSQESSSKATTGEDRIQLKTCVAKECTIITISKTTTPIKMITRELTECKIVSCKGLEPTTDSRIATSGVPPRSQGINLQYLTTSVSMVWCSQDLRARINLTCSHLTTKYLMSQTHNLRCPSKYQASCKTNPFSNNKV